MSGACSISELSIVYVWSPARFDKNPVILILPGSGQEITKKAGIFSKKGLHHPAMPEKGFAGPAQKGYIIFLFKNPKRPND
jgi:hypothetical protein